MLVLCGVPFVMVLGNSMLIPVLPAMRAALGVGRAESGLAITAFSVPAGVAIVLAGYLADRYGRKAVLVPALVLYALGGVLAFVAALMLKQAAFPWVLVGRVIQGIGAAGTQPVALAMAGDIFQSSERAKALGLLESANGLGKLLSPILGSALGLLGWYTVFAGYALFTLPIAAAVFLLTREPVQRGPWRTSPPPGEYFYRVAAVFRRKAASLVAAFVAGTVALSVLFGILFYLSETLEAKYRLDGIPKGGVLAVPVAAMSLTSYLTGHRLTRSLGLLKPAVVAGLALGAAGSLAIPWLGGARPQPGAGDWIFFAGIVVLGVGTGLVLPALNTLITSAVAEEERGMVTALYSATRFFGVALGPPVYGLLMGRDRALPFYFSAACLGAAAAACLLLLSPQQLMGGRQPGPGRRPLRQEPEEAGMPTWQPPVPLGGGGLSEP